MKNRTSSHLLLLIMVKYAYLRKIIPTEAFSSFSPAKTFWRAHELHVPLRRSMETTRQERRRHPILHSMKTQYTINDDVCPPMDTTELSNLVQKHCHHLQSFLDHKPIAKHTQAAFDTIYPLVDPSKPIILDSGCGTGRSTLLLGEMYPNHTIIGVDRSFVRLNRNQLGKSNLGDDASDQDVDVCHNEQSGESLRPFQAASSNTLLVRAELTDFWRCCLSENHDWNITHHYILYPNPYPKKNRVKKRFYAHPSFPLILKLGGEIVVRSNWEGYLKEFSDSVVYAHEYYHNGSDAKDNHGEDVVDVALPYVRDARIGPVERLDKVVAWTNFEKKYDDVGENTFELKLRRNNR